jgi:hypothetical protein
MMPLVGWLLGRHILAWTKTWGPWIAFGLRKRKNAPTPPAGSVW